MNPTSRFFITVVEKPVIEPMTPEEIRDHLRLDGDADDNWIIGAITAARELAEKFTGRSFLRQLIDCTWDRPPWSDYLELPRRPIISVTSITTYNLANTAVPFTSGWFFDQASGRIILNSGISWPADLRNRSSLVVRYQSGFGTTRPEVPLAIRQALYVAIADWFENRNPEGEGFQDLPDQCKGMLTPFKITWL